MKIQHSILFAGVLCFAVSCGPGSTDTSENGDDSAVIDLNNEVVSAENVFIYIPSPIQTADLLKQAGATYDADLLNKPENTSLYTTTASMALNMGVYGSDLAFAGIFNQNNETIKFMDCDWALDGGIGGFCPPGTLFMLNTKYLFWRPHAQRNMVPLSPNKRYAINQDAEVQIIGWAGNLTTSGSQFQGRMDFNG